MAFMIPDAQMCDYAVKCKGCKENIPASGRTVPDRNFQAECPLCHAKWWYVPGDVFRGRLSQKIATKVRKDAMGPLPPRRVVQLIAQRVQQRIDALKRVEATDEAFAIGELDAVLDLLQRGERYIIEQQEHLARTQRR